MKTRPQSEVAAEMRGAGLGEAEIARVVAAAGAAALTAGADSDKKLPARLEKWARMLHEGVAKDDVAARMRDAHCTEADVERVMAVAAMIASAAAGGEESEEELTEE